LNVGGGIRELGAEIAGADSAEGEAVVEAHIEPTTNVYGMSIRARSRSARAAADSGANSEFPFGYSVIWGSLVLV
jgi:hypothetical protein